ncbi:hypothetical protein Vafri_10754 [Volvox africanus]|uniref:Uncharacterized protein n=1 Tax=Volvox africanus TaxID=51714 RepID=A0A8J4F3N7_9CHLO|nr:hypothetical protein Vafri_10754 [Volvox africanus]
MERGKAPAAWRAVGVFILGLLARTPFGISVKLALEPERVPGPGLGLRPISPTVPLQNSLRLPGVGSRSRVGLLLAKGPGLRGVQGWGLWDERGDGLGGAVGLGAALTL